MQNIGITVQISNYTIICQLLFEEIQSEEPDNKANTYSLLLELFQKLYKINYYNCQVLFQSDIIIIHNATLL